MGLIKRFGEVRHEDVLEVCWERDLSGLGSYL